MEMLDEKQRKQVCQSQAYALRKHGFHPHSLFWSHADIQTLRFNILAEVGIENNDSLLDVGCGFGDFYHYLSSQKGLSIEYTGIDICQELLDEGRKHYTGIQLIQGDLFDLNPESQSVDIVALSGVFNRKYESAEAYAFASIQRMFSTCKKAIAFNMLDARHEWTASRWDLQSFHPEEISAFIEQQISGVQRYKIIDDYLDNDFTVYLYRY